MNRITIVLLAGKNFIFHKMFKLDMIQLSLLLISEFCLYFIYLLLKFRRRDRFQFRSLTFSTLLELIPGLGGGSR